MRNSHVTSLLLERLERIPADSIWAHRASGIRGSLLKMMEQPEGGPQVEGPELHRLIAYGFQILESVAREKHILSLTGVAAVLLGSIDWITHLGVG